MNTAIRFYALGFVLLLTSQLAQAQQRGQEWMEKPATERAQILTDWMTQELELSENQTQKSYDVNLKYAQKGDELKASNASKRGKFSIYKSNSEAKDDELKGIFSSEQYAQYEDKKAELRELMKENRG